MLSHPSSVSCGAGIWRLPCDVTEREFVAFVVVAVDGRDVEAAD